MEALSVLFASRTSVYKQLNVDVWDIDRDARLWPGGNPIIAHPPCAQWSRLRAFSKPNAEEKELAPWAIRQVQQHGGIVEHPESSKLWPYMGLPDPGKNDGWGWTLTIQQRDWEHTTRKNTRLYICGITPQQLPPIPIKLGKTNIDLQNISKTKRLATPPALAAWLITTCRAITR